MFTSVALFFAGVETGIWGKRIYFRRKAAKEGGDRWGQLGLIWKPEPFLLI
jgi:hypothetical protein